MTGGRLRLRNGATSPIDWARCGAPRPTAPALALRLVDRPVALGLGDGANNVAQQHRVEAASKAGSRNVLSLRVAWLNEDWNPLWATRPWVRAA